MQIGYVLWPLLWIWLGAFIGILAAAVLGANRNASEHQDRTAPPSPSIPTRVVEISVFRRSRTAEWDARLLDETGQIILFGRGSTPEEAIRDAIDSTGSRVRSAG